MRNRLIVGLVAAALYVLTVYFANLAVTRWGAVSVGFGLTAPAGVYFAGLAFTLRDVVHRQLGRQIVVLAIIAGAILSYELGATAKLGGPLTLAWASAIAFGASELADLCVYEPLRSRGWLPAVLASNVVGLVLDSMLFLWLAFGSLHFLAGQIVGKAWMTALAIALLAAWERFSREPVPA